jgi:EAL domain-containing protein (putative c-di-GMP-specific phosphodiesterase class I)
MQLREIEAALKGAMIETRYQPIVRLSDSAPVAVEALARLKHPSRGTLLPHRFVPQLENAGLASELTTEVASRAFADMAGPQLAPLHLDIALNFPLDVLLVAHAPTLLELHHRLQGIPTEQVIIELTESRPVEDLRSVGEATTRLRQAGYQVVIDDVQPAAPHLDALLDLPFTGLKFDKDIVKRIVQDPAAERFVSDIVEAAEARGLMLTAEGVENAPIWQRLVQLGVHRAQGFLIARPMMASAIPGWLRRWSTRQD